MQDSSQTVITSTSLPHKRCYPNNKRATGLDTEDLCNPAKAPSSWVKPTGWHGRVPLKLEAEKESDKESDQEEELDEEDADEESSRPPTIHRTRGRFSEPYFGLQ